MDLKEAGIPNLVLRAFALMEIAEEEILRAGGGKKANAAFRALEPGGLATFSDGLYRVHCRELLARAKKGEGLQGATKAEMLAALSTLSLKRPSDRNAAALQERLFAELFPGKLEGEPTREEWPGACDEILADLRRKLTRKGRT